MKFKCLKRNWEMAKKYFIYLIFLIFLNVQIS